MLIADLPAGMVKGFAPVYPNTEYEISRTAPKSHELLIKKATHLLAYMIQ